jgi:hypothetical protein
MPAQTRDPRLLYDAFDKSPRSIINPDGIPVGLRVCDETRDIKIAVRSENEPLWTVQMTYATYRVVDKNAPEGKRVWVKFQNLSTNSGASSL